MEIVRVGEQLPAADIESRILERMQAARAQLAEAKTLGEAKRVADGAAAIREWLRRQTDIGLEIVNDASLLKLEAEGRMGEFLQEPGAVKGDGRPVKPSQPVTVSPPTHKDLGINRESARRFQQVATVPRQTLRRLAEEATRRGVELTRESVLRVARQMGARSNGKHPAPGSNLTDAEVPVWLPDDFRNAVIIGDSRELSARIPDDSIALCLCDPVYDRIGDYEWLASECERVLEPGGSLIVQCGSLRRFECEVVMRRSKLDYVDLLVEVYPYAIGRLFKAKVFVGWKPYLWFSKGPRKSGWVMNRVHAGGKARADESKDIHPWGDSDEFSLGLIRKLCQSPEVVWDPFTGSGTVPAACAKLGLPFIAFEIDPQKAAQARQRIWGTPRALDPQICFNLDQEETHNGHSASIP